LALGRRRARPALALRLATPDMGGDWTWDFGDGERATSSGGEHAYGRPGTYRVAARRGKETREGRVTVDEPRPPKVAETALRGEDAGRPTLVGDEASTVEPHGPARYDRDRRMSPAGGWFAASAADAGRVTEALRRTNEMTLEATIEPASLAQTGTVLALASG